MIVLGRIKEIKDKWIKTLIYGQSDVRTSPQVTPYGIASKPIKEKIGLYLETDNKTKSVFLGCINIPEGLENGEIKMYATNDSGEEQSFIHCKKSDVASVGSGEDWAVKFTELASGLGSQDTDINAELIKISTTLGQLAAYVNGIAPGSITPYTRSDVNTDITNAKNKRIITND